MLAVANKYGKGHNLWIQGFGVPHGRSDSERLAKLTENPDLVGIQGLGVPSGREEEIVLATEGAYDAGARTILVWGFRGSEGNDYRAQCPDLTWKTVGDAMRRIQDRDRDEKLQALRKQFNS